MENQNPNKKTETDGSRKKQRIRQLMLLLLCVYAVILAAATFIEKEYGTPTALSVYRHPVVAVVWLLLAAGWCVCMADMRQHLLKRLGIICLHSSFLFIMAGAVITHFCGKDGLLHLREGDISNLVQTGKGETFVLPFYVSLEDFQLERYPGSHSPSSYKSLLTIHKDNQELHEEVYMNKILNIDDYRFFQTSYDPDECGTVLTVSHDPAGMRISYAGYGLLFAGILLIFFQGSTRLHRLARKLRTLAAAGLLLLPSSLAAADGWEAVWVQNANGRIEPMDTYCRTLLRKVSHDETYQHQPAVDVVLGWLSQPEHWNEQRIIYQTNEELARSLRQQGDYLCLHELFDREGNYVLAEGVEKAYSTAPNQRTKYQKDLLKLDEKVNILMAVEQGQMLPLFPLPGDERQRWFSPGDDLSEFSGEDSMFVSRIMAWYVTEPGPEPVEMIRLYQQKRSNCPIPSDRQMQLELRYNQFRPFFWSGMGYLAGGVLLTALLVAGIIRGRRTAKSTGIRAVTAFALLCFAAHTCGLAIRWYISGQAPWSNAYESMLYVAWCIFAAGLCFARRSPLTLALSTFLSGVALLVANMNWMDPAITPLVPVLQSYWLMIHVAVIIAGYGFFAISFLLGLTSLTLFSLKQKNNLVQRSISELFIVNEMSVIIGTCFMAAGTFLGAVWANEAWGRYWGWDPKETWALITMLLYAVVCHLHFLPKLYGAYTFSVATVFVFASVLMTYFGVNFFLSGLHSYGITDSHPGFYAIFAAYFLFLLLAAVAYRRRHKGYAAQECQ